jgi:hypothetical protein
MSRRAMLHKPATYSNVRPLAYVCCYRVFILKKWKIQKTKNVARFVTVNTLNQLVVLMAVVNILQQ